VEWRLIKSPIVGSRRYVGLLPDKPAPSIPTFNARTRQPTAATVATAMRVELRSIKLKIIASRRHVGPEPDKTAQFIPSFNASTNQRH